MKAKGTQWKEGQSQQGNQGGKKRILFIEPGYSLRDDLTFFLKEKGHDVVACRNSDEALRQLPDIAGFDLVIMELYMQVGTDLVEAARGKSFGGEVLFDMIRKKCPEKPVIILTTLDRGEITGLKFVEGVTEHFLKPLTEPKLEKLFELVNTITCAPSKTKT